MSESQSVSRLELARDVRRLVGVALAAQHLPEPLDGLDRHRGRGRNDIDHGLGDGRREIVGVRRGEHHREDLALRLRLALRLAGARHLRSRSGNRCITPASPYRQ